MSIVSRLIATGLCWFSVLGLPLGNSWLQAQDPTKPSAEILERLHGGTPAPSAPTAERRAAPAIKIKAIVMGDENHGTALLEVGGRKVRLQLDRSLGQASEAASSPSWPNGLDIDGVFHRVEEFTQHSILLNAQGHKLLIN